MKPGKISVDRTLPFDMPAHVRTLLDRLWLCRDEQGRLHRAFGRARPVERLYARVQRIVLMLDLAWAARDGDTRSDIQSRLESLMTWHPTLEKGMHLPAPDFRVYLAALDRLLAETGTFGVSSIARLRNLPESPSDWECSGMDAAKIREVNANISACSELMGHVIAVLFDRLNLRSWQWFEVYGQGIFKILDVANGWISLGNPDTGEQTSCDALSRLHEQSGRPVTDPARIAIQELRCIAWLPVQSFQSLRWQPARAELAKAWVAWPAFGQVVAVMPPERLWIGAPASAAIPTVCTDNPLGRPMSKRHPYWLVIASAANTDDLDRLSTAFGRFIREVEIARPARVANGQPDLGTFRRDRDRLQALWIRMSLESSLRHDTPGNTVPPGLIQALLGCKIDTRLRMASYGHMLGQIRHEAASRGEDYEIKLATALLSATRRGFAEPDSWAGTSDPRLSSIVDSCCGHDFDHIDIHARTMRPHTSSRKLILERIAEDVFGQSIMLFLFDFVDSRYHWSRGTTRRIEDLAGFMGRYASNRAAPAGSPSRRARGNALSLIDAFMLAAVAMIERARTLGLEIIECDLLSGEILSAGFEEYRYKRLATMTRDRFLENVLKLLQIPIEEATLKLHISRDTASGAIEMRLPSAGTLLLGRTEIK